MIPWVREKFNEKRAKWLARSSKRKVERAASRRSKDEEEDSSTTNSDTPRFHRLNNPEESDQNSQSSATISHHNCLHTRSLHSSPVKSKTRRSSAAASSSITNALVNSEDFAKACSSAGERIKIRVICPSARVLIFQTSYYRRLAELKNEIILELSDDLASSMPIFATDIKSLVPRFRLLRGGYEGSELNENQTLEELRISHNDTLVLVAKRNHFQQMMITRETRSPPDIDIDIATRNLTVRTSDVPMVDINEIFQQSNLQFDVRKVLISLAQSSAVIIGSGPYAKRLIVMLKQKLINKRNFQNDTTQCLVDMGFKKEKAEYALKLHNNVYSSALEWLIQRQSEDSSIEEAVMGIPRTNSSMTSPSGILSSDNTVENIAALLEIVRIYSYRDIPPTPDAIQALVEMGFQESDVIQALKKTCNNKAAACEWLCGNRTGSLVELREGLSQDSPILKTILQLPQVQLSLSNPKILLAFLAILENEHTIRVWGGDNDTTSIITHILQKYHEEKHVLGINQFYSSQ